MLASAMETQQWKIVILVLTLLDSEHFEMVNSRKSLLVDNGLGVEIQFFNTVCSFDKEVSISVVAEQLLRPVAVPAACCNSSKWVSLFASLPHNAGVYTPVHFEITETLMV